MTPEKHLKYLSWLLLLVLSFIWGSSFILMKRGLYDGEGMPIFSPHQVAAMRMFIAFLALLPFVVKIPRSTFHRFWKPLLASSMLGNLVPAFLFTYAQTFISSSLTGMLNASTPLFAFIVAIVFFKTSFRFLNFYGILLGLLGTLGLILLGNNANLGSVDITACLLVVLATVCYGISVNIIKNSFPGLSAFTITVCFFIIVGPPCGIYLLITDFSDVLATNPHAWSAIGYTVVLAVGGTAGALILFNKLVKMTSSVFASSVTYMIPVVAVLWGVWDGESVSGLQLASILVILSGVFLVNRK